MDNPSRRGILTAVAATVTLPVLQAALGRLRSAQAAAPATAAATAAATATSTAPATASGWFTTTLKAADLKDNEVVVVTGHKVLVTRSGKTVMAMTSVCTHKAGALRPKAGDPKLSWCPLHFSEFKLDGSVSKGPANKPLEIYAIRLDDKGMVEIDPTQKPTKDAKEASVTLS